METFDQMYERHWRERTAFMEDQYQSWNALQRQHDNDIPPDVYAQWLKDNGSQKLVLLQAKQAYERENYPESLQPLATQPQQAEPAPELAPDYQAFVDSLKQERNDSFREYFEKMAEMANDRNVTPTEFFKFFAVERERLSQMGANHYKQLVDHTDNPHYREQMDKVRREQEQNQRQEKESAARQRRMSAFQQMKQNVTQLEDSDDLDHEP